MSKYSEPALHFTIAPSRILRVVLDVGYGLTLIACCLNSLPIMIQTILVFSLVGLWVRSSKACKAAWYYLSYTANQGWSVSYNGHNYVAIALKSSTVTGPIMTFFHYNTGIAEDAKARAFVILRDAMSADDYRRLVVKLRLSGNGYR